MPFCAKRDCVSVERNSFRSERRLFRCERNEFRSTLTLDNVGGYRRGQDPTTGRRGTSPHDRSAVPRHHWLVAVRDADCDRDRFGRAQDLGSAGRCRGVDLVVGRRWTRRRTAGRRRLDLLHPAIRPRCRDRDRSPLPVERTRVQRAVVDGRRVGYRRGPGFGSRRDSPRGTHRRARQFRGQAATADPAAPVARGCDLRAGLLRPQRRTRNSGGRRQLAEPAGQTSQPQRQEAARANGAGQEEGRGKGPGGRGRFVQAIAEGRGRTGEQSRR